MEGSLVLDWLRLDVSRVSLYLSPKESWLSKDCSLWRSNSLSSRSVWPINRNSDSDEDEENEVAEDGEEDDEGRAVPDSVVSMLTFKAESRAENSCLLYPSEKVPWTGSWIWLPSSCDRPDMASVWSVANGCASECCSVAEIGEGGSIALTIVSSIAEMGWMGVAFWMSVLSVLPVLSGVVSTSEEDAMVSPVGSRVVVVTEGLLVQVLSKSTSESCVGKDSLGVERASSCFSFAQAGMAGSCLQVISKSGEADEASIVPEPESELVLVLPSMLFFVGCQEW